MSASTVRTIANRESPIPDRVTSYDRRLLMRTLAFEAPLVIEGITEKMKLSPEEAESLFMDVKRFLFLAATVGNEVIAPSPIIDDGWHIFILDTRSYVDFCMNLFGVFLHHRPMSAGEQLGRKVGERTIDLAVAMFGENLSPAWGKCGVRCSVQKCDCKTG